ncbi:Fumagillin dodecapentaenoate synthase [Lachnellula suecica]|uniref:Fumagillin dodecapentaenoate synthase n=1 Tax=Lachnellula suecica TaxID=602035 RepID=A0A8T9CCP4_9HELO|nr:Fumagillin dodecapentaenoate synthase [Lachnellula suecica]
MNFNETPNGGAHSSISSASKSSNDTDDYLRPQPKQCQVPIAIIGMACRLPGHCNSPQALWNFLKRGGIAANNPPDSRFSLSGHYSKDQKPRTMRTPGGMFLEDWDPALFDGQFFNINKVECVAMDPQQRQLLEVAYECLENAGVPMESLSGQAIGCLVGADENGKSTSRDKIDLPYVAEIGELHYEILQARDPEDQPESASVGFLARCALANRISHWLDITGPSMTIDTACSSSLTAIDAACRYLDTYQADGMIVGGAKLWITPEHNEVSGPMRTAFSSTGKCHSFDAKADGYVKGEAINVMFLKRYDDAVRDGDPIRAVIRGTASNHCGHTPGMASPSSEAQAAAIRTAYANAGIENFNDTGFLECHGTGTLAGDPIELAGAASVFAKTREEGQELAIGSIKSNIGHSEAAAGISGLLKAVLAIERGEIPGNPTFLTPNPNIDFHALRIRASKKTIQWPTQAKRRASVNSFGVGGANAHVVLEAAEHLHPRHVFSYGQKNDFLEEEIVQSPKPTLLVFSANDEQGLKGNIKLLSSHLINLAVSVDMADLAYTLSERRTHHYHRGFALTRSKSIDSESVITGTKHSSPPKIAFVFTGQGAQWSEMGLDLVNNFPAAKEVIQRLDNVLQSLSSPPSWSLLRELMEPRSTETLREPEFSQPLVTALQLAILQIMKDWNIRAERVVGHSSGEIAAAAAAGLITSDEAIKIAYYRGQSAKKVTNKSPLGMLAVGISAEDIGQYLDPSDSTVQIACYNSPSSLTLSGEVSALEKIMHRLKEDTHFARMLLVDLAYHSHYMAEIGEVYEQMLLENCFEPCKCERELKLSKSGRTKMYSSVTGQLVNGLPDAAYWKSNMVSPVKFSHATTELLQDQDGPKFLIEIGPSNALSGPISQIKKALSGTAANGQYTSTLKRGPDALLPLFDVAGRLFLAGGSVNLHAVNHSDSTIKPSVVIDLPNYSWNHSTSYWHETIASKDWRFKKFINHDLLGSKMNGTPWDSPVFKKTLKLTDLPWVLDHKMANQLIFPGSGFIAMAVEAIYQTTTVTEWMGKKPARYRYRLRDIKFSQGLVAGNEDAELRLMLSLTPVSESTRSWFKFKVSSLKEATWTEHSTGLIRIETDYQDTPAPAGAVEPLMLATPGRSWYKPLADIGHGYGPAFQKHLTVESTIGKRQSRSSISLKAPIKSLYGESSYPMHPTCIDGCFQTVLPPMWEGDRTNIDAVLVPSVIGSLVITGGKEQSTEAISVASTHYLGVGPTDAPTSYGADCAVYEPASGALLFEMSGLRTVQLETSKDDEGKHTFMRLSWDADISMLLSNPKPDLQRFLKNKQWQPQTISRIDSATEVDALQPEIEIQNIMNLIAHKNPTLTVLELNSDPNDMTSLWLRGGTSSVSPIRVACSQYHLASSDPNTLISAQEKYSSHTPSTTFSLFSTTEAQSIVTDVSFDLVVVKLAGSLSENSVQAILNSTRKSVQDQGLILVIGSGSPSNGKVIEAGLKGIGFGGIHSLDGSVYLCQGEVALPNGHTNPRPAISHISLLEPSRNTHSTITHALRDGGWNVQTYAQPLQDIKSGQTVLILDELSESVMDRLDARQWQVLQHLIQMECKILWLTSGAQLDVTHPTKAAINGFFRVLRAEEPLLQLVTLDLDPSSDSVDIPAVEKCLEIICQSKPEHNVESEFVERGGVVYISRVLPDTVLTDLQSDETSSRKTDVVNLRSSKSPIALRIERHGDFESIHYGETSPEASPLQDGCIEVELFAAGMSFKDVAIATGTVPGTLGAEGAGVVTRVSSGVTSLKAGQRVVVFDKGSFANHIQTTRERVHHIPDDMTFEEASTLCSSYLTAIYSLIDMAHLNKGQSVLIHSAAGGVGMAAIQLCQYLGAQIYATVGTYEKRQFLKSTFGLTDKRIYSSKTIDFAKHILSATEGKGVDVILNSLSGDLLDESWRVLADRGTMVDIGKKDIVSRNNISMEPFDRNTSFRAIDMSHERTPDHLVSRLMSKLFELFEGGHVKPITPVHRFSFSDIATAIRFMRDGTHIGKVVISDGPEKEIKVPVRRAPKSLHLRSDVCYLIVGGLKGLCGSLAIYLAKSGAKHVAVISRSGHNDEKSRAVVKQIEALGCQIDLLSGDVAVMGDVERAFRQTSAPIAGIIQGAMVLRDRTFSSMSIDEYHGAVKCKIQGTWNLHNAAQDLKLELDFFTMLSSISGLVGSKGQANYAAANVFLDNFATYRHQLGRPACSVDLGVIEDVGYIFERDGMQEKLDTSIWTGINERLLRKILYFSILRQQGDSVGAKVSTQIITGIPMPQPEDSQLVHDARFSALFSRAGGDGEGANSDGSGLRDVKTMISLLRSKAMDPAARLPATVDIVNKCLTRILRLSDPMETGRPLSMYGIDSLAAVEARNWIRAELGVVVVLLDILSASSLVGLCEKIVSKLTIS